MEGIRPNKPNNRTQRKAVRKGCFSCCRIKSSASKHFLSRIDLGKLSIPGGLCGIFGIWRNRICNQNQLNDYSAIIKASNALTEIEKEVLLRAQARLDVLEAGIDSYYEKAAEATSELTAQRDQAIAELQELYAKSANICDKVYGE